VRGGVSPPPPPRHPEYLATAPARFGAKAPHPNPSPTYDPDVAVGKRRILLVEDEASIVRPLADALGREGFDTRVAGTVEEGIALGRSADPDLVLLDLMLPDGSGFDVCRELRKASDVPIVMLTARGDEADRVVGLELGADDYVVKPFSAREVIARIRAVLRRVAPASEPSGETIQIGDVRLDPARRSVEVAGREVDLARREFELLHRLMLGAGAVITREQLIEDVWDMNWFGSTKTLDVHVSSLRRKLGDDPAEPSYIHTVRGVGFRFSSAREFEG
jgi:two-component system, OmpR family, response regulator RegX3